ncbi:MAG: hypothetical protein AAB867_03340 [Patescibacteria group bacterium]
MPEEKMTFDVGEKLRVYAAQIHGACRALAGFALMAEERDGSDLATFATFAPHGLSIEDAARLCNRLFEAIVCEVTGETESPIVLVAVQRALVETARLASEQELATILRKHGGPYNN